MRTVYIFKISESRVSIGKGGRVNDRAGQILELRAHQDVDKPVWRKINFELVFMSSILANMTHPRFEQLITGVTGFWIKGADFGVPIIIDNGFPILINLWNSST